MNFKTHIQTFALGAAVVAVSGCAQWSDATASDNLSAEMTRDSVREVANKVADWQLAQYDIKTNMMVEETLPSGLPEGWIYGTLHIGLVHWGMTSEQPEYVDAVKNISEVNQWLLGPRRYNADDHTIGQVYLDLYELHGESRMKRDVVEVFDWVLENPLDISLEFDTSDRIVEHWGGRRFSDVSCKWRWCWADAVFMAPPVWLKLGEITGDSRYVEFADDEFWEMTDYLYDPDEKLYLRDSRYFDQYAPNGKRIFWGRGNGWVYAGLARMLKYLPEDHHNRDRYEALFVEMGERLIEIQSPDGSWRTSLLDPDSIDIPESSGTGLLLFGLAWGVNNGLLDKEQFRPAIERAWGSLVDAVHQNGKLGWVQPVGYEPGSATKDDSHLYGVGALLLAAAEIQRLVESEQ